MEERRGRRKKIWREQRSIYVGESSRSLHERAVEHARDYCKSHEDSHMLKQWVGAHKSEPST